MSKSNAINRFFKHYNTELLECFNVFYPFLLSYVQNFTMELVFLCYTMYMLIGEEQVSLVCGSP